MLDRLDLDADNDGILDIVEAQHDGTDADTDGMIDGPVGADGIPDEVQDAPDNGAVNYGAPVNSDEDPNPDFQDLDSDNDSLSDLLEGDSGGTDADNDGVIDGPDTDGDGIADSIDAPGTGFGDDDGYTAPPDDDSATDPDSPDYIDIDSDDNGTDDIVEAGNAHLDGDDDGDIDYTGPADDVDEDGILDGIDDSDLDGEPDATDTTPNPEFGGLGEPDTDGDGIPDARLTWMTITMASSIPSKRMGIQLGIPMAMEYSTASTSMRITMASWISSKLSTMEPMPIPMA